MIRGFRKLSSSSSYLLRKSFDNRVIGGCTQQNDVYLPFRIFDSKRFITSGEAHNISKKSVGAELSSHTKHTRDKVDKKISSAASLGFYKSCISTKEYNLTFDESSELRRSLQKDGFYVQYYPIEEDKSLNIEWKYVYGPISNKESAFGVVMVCVSVVTIMSLT